MAENIVFLHLDDAYQQCAGLNEKAVNEGIELLNKLNSTINDLRNHWKGSDATTHINNLNIVSRELGLLISGCQKSLSDVTNFVIKTQGIRSENMLKGSANVDKQLDFHRISDDTQDTSDTSQFYVDVAELSVDYGNVQYVKKRFSDYINEISDLKDALFSNWQSGAGHEEAEAIFTNFFNNSNSYYSFLENAEKALGAAAGNIGTL